MASEFGASSWPYPTISTNDKHLLPKELISERCATLRQCTLDRLKQWNLYRNSFMEEFLHRRKLTWQSMENYQMFNGRYIWYDISSNGCGSIVMFFSGGFKWRQHLQTNRNMIAQLVTHETLLDILQGTQGRGKASSKCVGSGHVSSHDGI